MLCARVPRSVWLLTVLHVLLLLGWTVLVPTYRAPDEPYHVDMVRAAAGPEGWPALDQRALSTEVVASLVEAGYSSPDNPVQRVDESLQAEDATPRGLRPDFRELASGDHAAASNHLAQHPPLHYLVVATPVTLLTTVLPLQWSYDRSVWLMRATSVLMVAPLPLLAFAAARRITGRSGPTAVAAAVIPLAIPQLTHIGSVVNNDNLLVLLGGVLTVALLSVATGDTGRRTALWVGGLAGAALLTKGFALIVPLWIVGAYALAGRRAPTWRPALSAGATALAVAGLLGGWWWLRNLVRYGTVQPTLVTPEPADDAAVSVGAFMVFFTTRAVRRFWGAFGWDEAHLPAWLIVAAALLVLAGVALAFARRPPTGSSWRAELGVALLPVVGIAGIVAYGSWRWYAITGTVAGVQGRYLFPGVVGLACAVAVGYGWAARSRALPLVVFTVAMLLQAVAAYTVLVHFWGPRVLGAPRTALPALWSWSPWPPELLALGGLLVAVTGVLCLLHLIGGARTPAVPPASPSTDAVSAGAHVESRS